jgi:plastocyanin
MRRTRMALIGTLTAGTLALGACNGGSDVSRPDGALAAQPTVEATGTVIEVKMVSGGNGELFTPADITAQRGDVIRFVLEAGVHNVAFPADKNPAGVTLPAASAYLQIPGQKHDVIVDMPAGVYNYHCDPHAVLGMVGTLTVLD